MEPLSPASSTPTPGVTFVVVDDEMSTLVTGDLDRDIDDR
jgi:hypothetical protein